MEALVRGFSHLGAVGGLGLGVGLAGFRFSRAAGVYRGLPSGVRWVGPGLGVRLHLLKESLNLQLPSFRGHPLLP